LPDDRSVRRPLLDRRRLADWPPTVSLVVPELGPALFCHATPRNATEVFTRVTPEARVAEMMSGVTSPLVGCGHTHLPFDRPIGAIRVVNAGSVGMPFGTPGAHWLLLDREVSFRRTDYDLAAAAERIRATDYPDAEAFANLPVLAPPPEADLLARLERAASESRPSS
jgi:diadenosine tetraphosphatase ApaH/serine/threonine PP2A family protein phosphatase